MAFRQPSFVPSSRPTTAKSAADDEPALTAAPSFRQPNFIDSQEWVLFPSARAYSSTTLTGRDSTEQTPRTAGRSRASDWGSGNTAERSVQEAEAAGQLAERSSEDQVEEERDWDLDSLDEGLPAFHAHEPSRLLSEYFHPSSSVLPRHDGLGTFAIATPRSEGPQTLENESHDTASRKRSFDHHRRSSSAERVHGESPNGERAGILLDTVRRDRIEQWRLEHSRILLDEIERATRRQRAYQGSQSKVVTPRQRGSTYSNEVKTSTKEDAPREVKDEDRGAMPTELYDASFYEEGESLWQRLTRHIIHDFMGIDDQILSVILGESIPSTTDHDAPEASPRAKVPRLDSSISKPAQSLEAPWQAKLLHRLARELDILFQYLSDHPGAFSTPLADPLSSLEDYAGMPVTRPTSSRDPKGLRRPASMKTGTKAQKSSDSTTDPSSPSSIAFRPTLKDHRHDRLAKETSSYAALWGIEEGAEGLTASTSPNHQDHPEDHDYWESAPSLKAIFQRFMYTRSSTTTTPNPPPESASRPLGIQQHDDQDQHNPSSFPPPPESSHRNLVATTTTPDSLRRAALIRQYHPLTNRGPRHQHHHHQTHTTDTAYNHHTTHLRRIRKPWLRSHAHSSNPGSSCASESLRHHHSYSHFSPASSSHAAGDPSLSTSRNYYWGLEYAAAVSGGPDSAAGGAGGGGGSSVLSGGGGGGGGVGVWGEA